MAVALANKRQRASFFFLYIDYSRQLATTGLAEREGVVFTKVPSRETSSQVASYRWWIAILYRFQPYGKNRRLAALAALLRDWPAILKNWYMPIVVLFQVKYWLGFRAYIDLMEAKAICSNNSVRTTVPCLKGSLRSLLSGGRGVPEHLFTGKKNFFFFTGEDLIARKIGRK